MILRLRTLLEGLGEPGDLVVSTTEQSPQDGDFVVSTLEGRRVVRLWYPGVTWLETGTEVIHGEVGTACNSLLSHIVASQGKMPAITAALKVAGFNSAGGGQDGLRSSD